MKLKKLFKLQKKILIHSYNYKLKFYLFIFFLPFYLFSQNFNSGIICGLSLSQVSGDQLSGFNKIGPRLGLYVSREINWYKINLELQYLSKGSRETINYSEQNNYIDNLNYDFINNYNLKLNYIGIPVLFCFNLNKKIEIEIGNEINVLVFQREEIDYYVDNSREVNKLEYCFLIGLNYKINKKYSANIRATNSIIPIRKHSSGGTYRFNRGQYNTTVSINILYNFNNSE